MRWYGGWPGVGGRQVLRRRLMLRRASLGVTLALVIGSQQTAQGAVSSSLVASTVQASMQYATGQAVVGYVSQNALSLVPCGRICP